MNALEVVVAGIWLANLVLAYMNLRLWLKRRRMKRWADEITRIDRRYKVNGR